MCVQQCPENKNTIQLEWFCYPNQQTKQHFGLRKVFLKTNVNRPCDKQTTNFPNFVFAKVIDVQNFFLSLSIVILGCDQDFQISIWLKPLNDCGCAKLN